MALPAIKISYQDDNDSVKGTENTIGGVMHSPY